MTDKAKFKVGDKAYSLRLVDGKWEVGKSLKVAVVRPFDSFWKDETFQTGHGSCSVYKFKEHWVNKAGAQAECERRNTVIKRGGGMKIYAVNEDNTERVEITREVLSMETTIGAMIHCTLQPPCNDCVSTARKVLDDYHAETVQLT